MSTLDWFLGKRVVIRTPGHTSEGVPNTTEGVVRAAWRETCKLGITNSMVTVVADDGTVYERQLGGDQCKLVVEPAVEPEGESLNDPPLRRDLVDFLTEIRNTEFEVFFGEESNWHRLEALITRLG